MTTHLKGIHIRFDDETLARLKKYSQENCVSKAKVTNQAVKEFLDKMDEKEELWRNSNQK